MPIPAIEKLTKKSSHSERQAAVSAAIRELAHAHPDWSNARCVAAAESMMRKKVYGRYIPFERKK